ncbi:hypothetical protein Catovirus_1_84 [Catovirus CTV1]|uniref:Uncharacterized protein n=1 Tax=Catovirus CTV1 TaxID=1977631 RepID=A0A1V0S8K0_9VIRU|nr:hypothetical protein Catovirus_1_84 [Catovirus CTV1]
MFDIRTYNYICHYNLVFFIYVTLLLRPNSDYVMVDAVGKHYVIIDSQISVILAECHTTALTILIYL